MADLPQPSFRLVSLVLHRHPVLGELSVDFRLPDEPALMTTLIIGANGTGKSQLLRCIADIFRTWHSDESRSVGFGYSLEYRLDKERYRLTHTISDAPKKNRVLSGRQAFKNDVKIELAGVVLPKRVLACSFLVNDKFLFKNAADPHYAYLGIRTSNSVSRTSAFVKGIVQNTIRSTAHPDFVENLEKMLDLLQLRKSFNVSFSLRYWHDFFSRPAMSIDHFKWFFRDLKNRRLNEPYSIGYFEKLSEPEISELVSYLNGGFKSGLKNLDKHPEYELNLLSAKSKENYPLIRQEFELIKKLMRLDLLSSPRISLKKEGSFDLAESSSGELHLISTFISIMANLESGSLILVDEPELSLHPNWQTRYVHLLKTIFSRYADCHFIISTHSHFLVSDLDPLSSSIIIMRRDSENRVLAEVFPENPYGWTAENVLYNVFLVPTTRNSYVADEVGIALHLLGQYPRNVVEIKKQISKLKKIQLNLKEIDPLKGIIDDLIRTDGLNAPNI